MTDGIEIVGLSRVSDQARAAFYQQAFADRASLLAAHWRWWYRVGFRPGLEPQIAVERGRVVGQAGIIPGLLRVAGVARVAQWYVDFAVLPDYQGKGLGQRLTEAWMQLGDTYITHCNDRSMGVFRKYGFRERNEMIRYARPIRPGHMFAHHRSAVVRLGATLVDRAPWLWAKASWRAAPRLAPAPIVPDRLAEAFDANGACELVHDDAWARWRLYDSPFRDQYAMFAHDGARAIVRTLSYAHVRRVHLLWLSGADALTRRELVQGVARWALREGADVLWAAANTTTAGAAIAPALPFQKRFRFAFLSRDQACFDQLARHPLALQAIDSDTDAMYA